MAYNKKKKQLTSDEIAKEAIKIIKKLKRLNDKPWFEIEFHVHVKQGIEAELYVSDNRTDMDLVDPKFEGWDNITATQLENIGTFMMPYFNGYEINMEKYYFGYGLYGETAMFPRYVRKMGTPCKEFKELARLVKRKYNIDLTPSTLYDVELFNDGHQTFECWRDYTAYKPDKCQEFIDTIKSYGRKRTKCEIKERENINVSKYDIETNGWKYVELVITPLR